MPSNNQPNFALHPRSDQQSRNNNIIDAMITTYVVSQEATTPATMDHRNKHAGSRK
jgi:hypothetical protein